MDIEKKTLPLYLDHQREGYNTKFEGESAKVKEYFFEKLLYALKENHLDDLVNLKALHSDIKSLYTFTIEEHQKVIEIILDFCFQNKNLLSVEQMETEMLSAFVVESIDYHVLGEKKFSFTLDWKKVKELEDTYNSKNAGTSNECPLFKIFPEDFKTYYSDASVAEVWELFQTQSVVHPFSNNEHTAQKRLHFLLKYMKFEQNKPELQPVYQSLVAEIFNLWRHPTYRGQKLDNRFMELLENLFLTGVDMKAHYEEIFDFMYRDILTLVPIEIMTQRNVGLRSEEGVLYQKIARFMVRLYCSSQDQQTYQQVWEAYRRIFKLVKPYLNPGNLNLNIIFDFFANFVQFFIERLQNQNQQLGVSEDSLLEEYVENLSYSDSWPQGDKSRFLDQTAIEDMYRYILENLEQTLLIPSEFVTRICVTLAHQRPKQFIPWVVPKLIPILDRENYEYNSVIELLDALLKPTIFARGKEVFRIPEVAKKLLEMISGSNPNLSLAVVEYFSTLFEYVKIYDLEDVPESKHDKLTTKKRVFYTQLGEIALQFQLKLLEISQFLIGEDKDRPDYDIHIWMGLDALAFVTSLSPKLFDKALHDFVGVLFQRIQPEAISIFEDFILAYNQVDPQKLFSLVWPRLRKLILAPRTEPVNKDRPLHFLVQHQSEAVQQLYAQNQLDVIKEDILVWYLGILEASIAGALITEEQFQDLHLVMLLTLTDERESVIDSGSELLYRLLRNFADVRLQRTSAEFDGHFEQQDSFFLDYQVDNRNNFLFHNLHQYFWKPIASNLLARFEVEQEGNEFKNLNIRSKVYQLYQSQQQEEKQDKQKHHDQPAKKKKQLKIIAEEENEEFQEYIRAFTQTKQLREGDDPEIFEPLPTLKKKSSKQQIYQQIQSPFQKGPAYKMHNAIRKHEALERVAKGDEKAKEIHLKQMGQVSYENLQGLVEQSQQPKSPSVKRVFGVKRKSQLLAKAAGEEHPQHQTSEEGPSSARKATEKKKKRLLDKEYKFEEQQIQFSVDILASFYQAVKLRVPGLQQSNGEFETWLYENSNCLKYSQLDKLHEDLLNLLRYFSKFLVENRQELESRVIGESFLVLLEEVKSNLPSFLRHEDQLYYIQRVNERVWGVLSPINKQKLVWVTFFKRVQFQSTLNQVVGLKVLPEFVSTLQLLSYHPYDHIQEMAFSSMDMLFAKQASYLLWEDNWGQANFKLLSYNSKMSLKMLTEELEGGKNLIQLMNEGDKRLQSYCQNVLAELNRIWGRLFEWVDVRRFAHQALELIDLIELVYELELPDEREQLITGVATYIRQKFYEVKKNLKFWGNKESQPGLFGLYQYASEGSAAKHTEFLETMRGQYKLIREKVRESFRVALEEENQFLLEHYTNFLCAMQYLWKSDIDEIYAQLARFGQLVFSENFEIRETGFWTVGLLLGQLYVLGRKGKKDHEALPQAIRARSVTELFRLRYANRLEDESLHRWVDPLDCEFTPRQSFTETTFDFTQLASEHNHLVLALRQKGVALSFFQSCALLFQDEAGDAIGDEEGGEEEGGLDMGDLQDMIDFALYQELFTDNPTPAKSRKDFVQSSFSKIVLKLFQVYQYQFFELTHDAITQIFKKNRAEKHFMDIVGVYAANLVLFLASSNLKLSFTEKQGQEMREFAQQILLEMLTTDNKYVSEYLAVDNFRVLLANYPPNEEFYLEFLAECVRKLGKSAFTTQSPLLDKLLGIYQIFISKFRYKAPQLYDEVVQLFIEGEILDQKQQVELFKLIPLFSKINRHPLYLPQAQRHLGGDVLAAVRGDASLVYLERGQQIFQKSETLLRFIEAVTQKAVKATKVDQDKYTRLLLSVIVIFLPEIITEESYAYLRPILQFLLDSSEEDLDTEQARDLQVYLLVISSISIEESIIPKVLEKVFANFKHENWRLRRRALLFYNNFAFVNSTYFEKQEVIENLLPFLLDGNKDIKKDVRACLMCQFQIMGSENLQKYRQKLFKLSESEKHDEKLFGTYGLISIVEAYPSEIFDWSDSVILQILKNKKADSEIESHVNEFVSNYLKMGESREFSTIQLSEEVVYQLKSVANAHGYFA